MNRTLVFVFACSAALSASAGAAYLAVIGPAPLRFEARARPIPRAIALLPPLLMQDPLPPTPLTNAVTQTTATNPPPETVAVSSPAPVPVVTNLPIVTTLSVTNPPFVLLPSLPPAPTGPLLGPLFDPNDPTSLLTAQMLIHYFRPQGTNAAGVSVLGPLFVPPRPASPPSSTVRYSTP